MLQAAGVAASLHFTRDLALGLRDVQLRSSSKAAPSTAVVGHPSSAAPVRPGILRNTWKVANEAEKGWEKGLSGRQAGFHEMGTATPLEGRGNKTTRSSRRRFTSWSSGSSGPFALAYSRMERIEIRHKLVQHFRLLSLFCTKTFHDS